MRAGAEDGGRGRDVGVPDGRGAGREPAVEAFRQRDELEDGERPEAEERPRGAPAGQLQRPAPPIPEERAERRGQRDEGDGLRRPKVHAAEGPGREDDEPDEDGEGDPGAGGSGSGRVAFHAVRLWARWLPGPGSLGSEGELGCLDGTSIGTKRSAGNR